MERQAFLEAVSRHGLASTVLLSSLALSACVSQDKCEVRTVYSQNRFQPPGAALRAKPDLSKEDIIGAFAPNAPINVDGWKHTGTVYPELTKHDKYGTPFENDVMFRVAGQKGWVAFQAVRAETTQQAPSNTTEDVGRLVVLSDQPNCEIK